MFGERDQTRRGNFRELLHLIHPLQKGLMMTAMFEAYLDESEITDANTFAVGGFVGTAQAWTEVESPWLKALPRGIAYFHATECFSGTDQFRNITVQKRIELLDTLTDLLIEHGMYLVCAGIDVAAYTRVAPKRRKNAFLSNKYVASFEQAVDLVCQSLYRNPPNWNQPVVEDPCAFLIERGPFEYTARHAFGRIKNKRTWYRGLLGTDTWGSKKPTMPDFIPLLQVGDLGAFLGAKMIAEAPAGRISWEQYFWKLANARRVFQLLRLDADNIKVLYDYQQSIKLTGPSLLRSAK